MATYYQIEFFGEFGEWERHSIEYDEENACLIVRNLRMERPHYQWRVVKVTIDLVEE